MKDPSINSSNSLAPPPTSIEDAVDKAIQRAHKTIKNLCWFQLVETRGSISKGRWITGRSPSRSVSRGEADACRKVIIQLH